MADNLKKSFVMYIDMYTPTESLSLSQKGELWDAVFMYQSGKEVRLSDPMAQMAFLFFRQAFDRDAEKYEAVREKRKIAGRLGGTARNAGTWQKEANVAHAEQNLANAAVNVNDTDIDIALNTPLSPLEGGAVQGKPARMKVEYPSDFEAFWTSYPRKQGKDAALRAWKTKKRERRLPELPVLLAAIEAAKYTEQWQRDGGQYIPQPATWINQGRWLDETEEMRERQRMQERRQLEQAKREREAAREREIDAMGAY